MIKTDSFHVNLESVILASRDGSKTLNLKDYIYSISIVEDVFSPFIHCEINVFDYNYISTKFPLIGEEFLSITFSADKQQTTFNFLVYRNSFGGFNDTNKMQYYTLFGTTLPYALDGAIKVSKSFSNLSYGEIVNNLFNSYFSNSQKIIKVEPTKGIHKFIVPGISPFSAISLCKKRSVSVKEPYTPFLFFENQEGYNFVSVNTLFGNSLQLPGAQIRHAFVNNLPGQDEKERSLSPLSTNVVAENTINDVLSFDVVDKYNTVDKLRHNVFYSSVRFFDLTTKALNTKEFKLSDSKNKFFLGNGGEFNTPFLTDELSRGFSISGPLTVVDTGRVFDQSSVDFYPDALASMNAYKELMLQERVTINIYGDNTIKAGDVFNFVAVLPTGKLDPTVAGNYLIISLKHLITIDSQARYIQALECVKGNYIDDIGGLSAR